MPLIILGIIVVIGACLMIYYQIGPTLKSRVKTPKEASSAPGSDKNEPFGGYIDLTPGSDFVVEPSDENEFESGESKPYEKSADGKVLYVFDAGKTEIRPLDEEEKITEEEDKEEEE